MLLWGSAPICKCHIVLLHPSSTLLSPVPPFAPSSSLSSSPLPLLCLTYTPSLPPSLWRAGPLPNWSVEISANLLPLAKREMRAPRLEVEKGAETGKMDGSSLCHGWYRKLQLQRTHYVNSAEKMFFNKWPRCSWPFLNVFPYLLEYELDSIVIRMMS